MNLRIHKEKVKNTKENFEVKLNKKTCYAYGAEVMKLLL